MNWSAQVRNLALSCWALPCWALPCWALAGWTQVVVAQAGPPGTFAPTRFERILWSENLTRGVALAPKVGCTGVQVGRGVDPTPIAAAGLVYYLDQPIGKGVLELRDEQWLPLQREYEVGRDPVKLVRPGCFQTPGLIAGLAEEAANEARRVAGPALRFIALADEASATRHDAPLDTCRCAACTEAFRSFVRRRFRTIGAYDEAVGAEFATFEDVVPLSTDQVRRRELGDTMLPRNLRPFALRQEFVDEQYATAIRKVVEAVQAAVPSVPVGLTGLPAPSAFGGHDYARLLPLLTCSEPYEGGGAPELARSLGAAGSHRFATLFPPEAGSPASSLPLDGLLRARLAAIAAQGLAGAVVWNDTALSQPDGSPTPFGLALRRAFDQMSGALDACAGAELEAGTCWVVESQASVRTWWMLDSARDGMTWVRRLSSYEATHSTSQAARVGWSRLLQDLGLQPRFVGEAGLAERLLQEHPRCLVLPATISVEDRTAQAIVGYVKSGGTVFADHTPALYDGDLVLRTGGGALDELFGVRSRSLRWDSLAVREGSAGLAKAKGIPVAERGLEGRLAERVQEGDVFLEARLGKGRAVYLNAPICDYGAVRLDESQTAKARELRRRARAVLQQAGVEPPCDVRGAGLPTCIERVALRLRDGRRLLVIRMNALEDPRVLAQLAQGGSRPVTVELPQARHLRVLGGEDLGTAAKFDLRLDPLGALFLLDLGP